MGRGALALLALQLFCLLPATPSSSEVNDTTGSESIIRPMAGTVKGDIVLGGLFPVHNKNENPIVPCGEIQGDRGIQRMEAMLWALDCINADDTILPGVRLGASIMDTCSRDTYALEQSLEYVRASMSTLDTGQFECDDGSTAQARSAPAAVVGVIGGAYSSVSIQVANLLRLFKIPQISYASTSTALSDKTRFEFFARTVPPDSYQAKAIMDIVQYYNWTYISTVYSEGDYGESGIEAITQEANARNICIAVNEKIGHSAKNATFDHVIDRLRTRLMARAVILFIRVEDARNLLLAAKRQNTTSHFVWVAADGWGKQEMPIRGLSSVAEGALTIELTSNHIGDFDDYFKQLDPLDNVRNPWFKEYWEHIHKCKFLENDSLTAAPFVRNCTGQEKINKRLYKQESKIQFVYDTVQAMARALHVMVEEDCPDLDSRKECAQTMQFDGTRLYRNILNVSFSDKWGGVIKFDERGDGIGRYNIFNFRRNRNKAGTTWRYEYENVGVWASGLHMDHKKHIMWAGGTWNTPVSQCSKPCEQGMVKNMRGESCCWGCMPCRDWQYVFDEFTCMDCGPGHWPYENKSGCYALPEEYMLWDSVFAIVPMCVSILGILLTFVVISTFSRHIDTPIVKASGRELSFMLLAGFLICYLMTFVLLAKPSPIMCGIQRFGIGFGFSVTYASLLTKTNRISRIFDSASKSAKRPAFISPRSQVVITCLLISVQVVTTCVWLVLEPPGTRKYFPHGRRNVVILKCKIEDISFLISLVYNMLLIIICTVYAVKTRKIPENFNESKFIGFTMYTTCIIWLAFVPIYFGTLNSFEIQTTTLCVSISLSASVALFCLFTPKMYILVFQPEKNVRKLTMNSATYKKTGTSSISGPTSNHGPQSETIKLRTTSSTYRVVGATTETETDRDSMASLMFEDCPMSDVNRNDREIGQESGTDMYDAAGQSSS